MTLYRNVDRSLVQFDFVVHGSRVGVLEREVCELGGHIHRVPRLTVLGLPAYLRAWSELLGDHPEYKIVHGHYFTISGVYLAVAKFYQRKIVAHSHNTVPGFAGLVIQAVNAWLRFGADLKLACSTDAAAHLYGNSTVRKGAWTILKNPIDVDRFAFNSTLRESTRQRLKISDRFVVGHVGRFNPQKNHAFLLDVFQKIAEREPGALLLLVGDGPLRAEIANEANKRSLADSVIFAGASAEVPALLQAMDVFVLPSLFEGFGVVALEAQAAGLPTVVSDAVPTEAIVTDLVETVQLSASSDEWASVVVRQRETSSRTSHGDAIKNAGFDGEDSARQLQGLYLDLAGTGRSQVGPS